MSIALTLQLFMYNILSSIFYIILLIVKKISGVIFTWKEAGFSGNDNYWFLNVTTIFESEGKKLKKLLNVGLGEKNFVHLKM